MKRVYLYIVPLIAGAVLGFAISAQLNITNTSDAGEKVSVREVEPDKPDDVLDVLPTGKVLNEIAKQVKPSVVSITSERIYKLRTTPFPFEDDFFHFFFNNPPMFEREFKEFGLGSGVIITEDGYILTNNHVVKDADKLTVRIDNRKYDAEIVGKDEKTDIAVVKIDPDGDKLHPAKIGDSDRLVVGEWVVAIGNPFRLEQTMTAGIVSATGRSNIGLTEYENFIQTDCAINPGNSGGALVNLNGELVGINTAIISRSGGSEGVGLAIPINIAKSVMQSIITKGYVSRGWLGVYIQDINENLKKAFGLDTDKGVLVSSVVEDSPAEKAGIESGDVILKIDGKEIENTLDLRTKIASSSPGTRVTITLLRNGKEKNIDVILGEMEHEQVAENAASREKLGLVVKNITPETARSFDIPQGTEGVVITDVEPGSRADEAGLKKGDIIKEVNRHPVTNVKQFAERIKEADKGRVILLLIERDKANLFVAIPEGE